MERAFEAQVGDVRLPAGDAVEPADASRRRSDDVVAHDSGPRRRQDGFDDLLVPGAAAQVAGEALLHLGPGRVRVVREQGVARDELTRDAEPALDRARVEERLLERRAAGRPARDPRPW